MRDNILMVWHVCSLSWSIHEGRVPAILMLSMNLAV